MKTVFLDGAELSHDTLAAALEFPAYYGRNLDALQDCLGNICEPTAIVIENPGAILAEGRRILAVIRDSAAENPCITVYLAARLR